MQLMEKLTAAWEAGRLGKWSSAEDLFAISRDAEDCSDATHPVTRFEQDLPHYKSILAAKHAKKIQAAVEVLFQDVNSSAGDKDAVIDALGQQHGPGVDDFDGRITSPALRQLIVDYVVRK